MQRWVMGVVLAACCGCGGDEGGTTEGTGGGETAESGNGGPEDPAGDGTEWVAEQEISPSTIDAYQGTTYEITSYDVTEVSCDRGSATGDTDPYARALLLEETPCPDLDTCAQYTGDQSAEPRPRRRYSMTGEASVDHLTGENPLSAVAVDGNCEENRYVKEDIVRQSDGSLIVRLETYQLPVEPADEDGYCFAEAERFEQLAREQSCSRLIRVGMSPLDTL